MLAWTWPCHDPCHLLASCCRAANWPTLSPSCYSCSYSWAMLNIWFKNWCFATFPLLVGFLLLPDLLMMNWSKLFTTSWSNLFTICCLALVLFSSRNSRLKSEKPIRWQNWILLPIFAIQALNPTLHGLKNVAGDTGGGHYGHPLENDPRGHFCGQIDL